MKKMFSSEFRPTLTYQFDYILSLDLFEKIQRHRMDFHIKALWKWIKSNNIHCFKNNVENGKHYENFTFFYQVWDRLWLIISTLFSVLIYFKKIGVIK